MTRPTTILIGDDDTGFSTTVKKYLELVGYEDVRTEQRCDDFVQTAIYWQPDVVLSDYDYSMFCGSYTNGLEALEAIRDYVDSDQNNGWPPKLILWSGLWRDDAAKAEGIEHITKSVSDLKELLA